eukprot:TRINITY_DN11538_c0_g1_i1.p1 TRINITY_DN11538_c0_g1~~TRINITY_DN11538_c0_g1_i1.p1  ORF type:complete len:215 (+),score=29.91 TRINITY_DN11538_c0_g1_i1:41-685(+)
MIKGYVFCTHGFLVTPLNTLPLATYLRVKRYEVENWGYPWWRDNLAELSGAMVHQLNHFVKENAIQEHQPVHFVTHSLGGLILRGALNHPDCPPQAKIGRAVLIAPLIQGSQWARVVGQWFPPAMFNPVWAELATTEQHGFDRLGEFPSEMAVKIILGNSNTNFWVDRPNDGTIAHKESFLNTPHQVEIIEWAGHSMLQWLPSTFVSVSNFLEE